MTSLAVWSLTACGIVVFLIGVYFVPALGGWLRRVFWVLGGFAVTTGILVVYVARTEMSTNSVGGLVILTWQEWGLSDG